MRAFTSALITWLQASDGDTRKIRVLINNAGLGANTEFRKNKAGDDAIFTANHLGHFLLTLLLLPHISERIVNVSSEVHDPDNRTPMPDPMEAWPVDDSEENGYKTRLLKGVPLPGENAATAGMRRYARSKLCNVFFTNELARRLSGSHPASVSDDVATALDSLPGNASITLPHAKQLKVIAYNPGLMLDTNFAANSAGKVLGFLAWAVAPILRLTPLGALMRSGSLSGERLARLALGEIAGEATATYVSDESILPSSVFSRSMEGTTKHAVALWTHSLEWAELTPSELTSAGLQ